MKAKGKSVMKKRSENSIALQILAGLRQHAYSHEQGVRLCGFPNQFSDFTRAARNIDIYGISPRARA